MKKKARVMVIAHEASLSGAPVLLLNLFRLLVEKDIVSVQFVIRKGGVLVKEYEKIAPVIVLKSPGYGQEKNLILRTAHFLQNKWQLGTVLFKAFFCDYFFCNTIVNGKLLGWLRLYKKPIITYVHELERVIDLYKEQGDARLPLSISSAMACPCDETMQLLLNKYKIDSRRLRKLHYYFPFSKALYKHDKAEEKARRFRQKFDIPENDFIIGAAGTISERKGVDLFMQVGKIVSLQNASIKFVWIGAFESATQESGIRNFIKKNQLETKLIFPGALPYDIYNFSPFDLLFLSSLEDTYPLVVLEAAMMKVPAICFSGSGGITEFVGEDAGWTIDDFSIKDVASKIAALKNMKDVVEARGNVAFNKVLNLHCNENSVIAQYNDLTESLN